MKKALLSSLVVGSVLIGANAALGAILEIDNFAQTFNPVTGLSVEDGVTLTDSQNQTGLPTSSVIGGSRNTTLGILNPGTTLNDITLLQTSTAGTGLVDQSVAGVDGNLTRTTFTWNGGGAGLNANLSAFDRFRLTLSLFDLVNNPATTDIGTITVRARNSSVAPYVSSSQTLSQISTLTDRDFFFSSFSGLSFNSIFDIQLEIEGNFPGLLFTIDDLQAFSPTPPPPNVPEPALALGCLLLGGTQFAITGWKRYKNSRKS